MNCTYCFNNNIPNHYQIVNSLSIECKALCFHYDLLLKKTIFKSPILSYLPNYLGSFGEAGHAMHVELCMSHYFNLKELTFSDIHVNYPIGYLFSFKFYYFLFSWTCRDSHKWLSIILKYLDNLEKDQSKIHVRH